MPRTISSSCCSTYQRSPTQGGLVRGRRASPARRRPAPGRGPRSRPRARPALALSVRMRSCRKSKSALGEALALAQQIPLQAGAQAPCRRTPPAALRGPARARAAVVAVAALQPLDHEQREGDLLGGGQRVLARGSAAGPPGDRSACSWGSPRPSERRLRPSAAASSRCCQGPGAGSAASALDELVVVSFRRESASPGLGRGRRGRNWCPRKNR